MTAGTIYATRRANLTDLLQERGAKTALALKLGVSQSHVSHLLRPPDQQFHRPIHEDTARQIEKVLGLDPGRLDRPLLGELPTTAHVAEPAVAYPARIAHHAGDPPPEDARVLEESVRVVVAQLMDTQRNVASEKVAGLVRLVYEQAALTGKVDEGFVRQLLKLAV